MRAETDWKAECMAFSFAFHFDLNHSKIRYKNRKSDQATNTAEAKQQSQLGIACGQQKQVINPIKVAVL